MNCEQTKKWRTLVGKAGIIFVLLVFYGALDGLVSLSGCPGGDVIGLIQGESEHVNGQLARNIRSLDDLTYVSDSDLIRLSFEAVHPGFWMGGTMWRGILKVDRSNVAGEHTLSVFLKGAENMGPQSVLKIKVYPDSSSYRKDSRSFLYRHLGLSPWWLTLTSFFLVLIAFGSVFLISQKLEKLLNQEGKATIYVVTREGEEYRIGFGLGKSKGVTPGMLLTVLDENEIPVEKGRVMEASERDSVARIGVHGAVMPGHIVRLDCNERLNT